MFRARAALRGPTPWTGLCVGRKAACVCVVCVSSCVRAARQVRQRAQEKLGRDLTSAKPVIKQLVEAFIEERDLPGGAVAAAAGAGDGQPAKKPRAAPEPAHVVPLTGLFSGAGRAC